MPPKQKQVKKGPAYKNPILTKDLIPSDIKEIPRQPKPLKYPQTFPEQIKNQKKSTNLFEAWPAEQLIKSYDFGINSQQKFEDSQHQKIIKMIKNSSITHWKSISQIQKIRNQMQQQQASLKQIKQQKSQNSINNAVQQKEQKKQILVIQTYEREQTKQQIQIRLKQQAQKAQKAAKDKKKGKKQQVKQQGPVKVKDVRMANIEVQKYMSSQGIWIGSQLQTIKLRNIMDAYTRQPVWKKIYPQQNGVPQLTKSGKYWIKLYYMGQPIKIQIDDRIPINQYNQQLFPLSQKNNQKWTLLLAKALIKYMNIINPEQQIVGNGMIFHALTGMICETIQLNSKQWQTYQNLLNDYHYLNKDILLSCFTSKHQTIHPPSNNVKNISDLKQRMLLQNSSFKNKISQRNNLSYNEHMGGQQIQQHHNMQDSLDINNNSHLSNINNQIQSYILSGYGYCIGDYFANEQFNMVFSKQKSNLQLKLRQQYNNLSKVNLNNKTRDQKLQHRKKKKQIKQLLLIQQKKRLDLLNQQKRNYHFIKLLSNLNVFCQYSQKQILLAKKCKINNLSQPPNYQIPSDFKDDNKSVKSFSIIKTNKQQAQINPDLNDFSSLQNPLQPLSRSDQGIWIKDIDFTTCFSNIQIIYNPTSFQHKSIQKIISTNQKSFSFDENKQILVIQKIQLNEQGQQTQQINLLFGFYYQSNQTNQIHKPYTILQKFDFDQFSVINNITKLSNKIDSNYLTLNNQNTIFKIYTMCKGNYTLWISSNAKFKLMSISEYLQQFEGYKKKTFNIQYPALQAKHYFNLAKFAVKQNSQQYNSAIMKINCQNSDLSKNITYKLIKNPTQSDRYIFEQNQGVVRKKYQKKYLAYENTRIRIQPQQNYDFVLQCCPNQNIIQGTCEIIVYMKNQSLFFEPLQLVQPVKYIEKYKPNKYGLIFKQRLFSNTINRQSFLVKVVEGQQVAGSGGADKKAAKKGGKQQTAATQFIQKPLEISRKLIVRLIKNDEILYQSKGTNWTTISNVRISNTKQNKSQYFIQASFDLIQWPDARYQNQDTAKICWVIESFGTDSIALIRDTKQEDRQKQTKKSWEDKQPGRAQKAKKARRKFLILLKQQNGQALTQQELQILNAPRLSKKQLLEEEKLKNQDKNKKGGKKDDKKGAKQVKKQQVIQQKVINIVFPKSIDNCSSDIKSFLKVLQDFKVKTQIKPEGVQQKIRSQQQLKAIKNSQILCQEDRIGKILKNIERRQTIKLKQRDKKDQLTLYLQELNRNFKQSWSKYVAWRNQDLEKDKSRQQKERSILQILQNQKPTCSQTDLQKVLNEYQNIANFNQKLYDVGIMLKKNLKINNLTEKISNHLTNWQIEELKAINQVIKNEKIQGVAENIMKQMTNLLQEAQKNPAMIIQKQNEAKKAKKGGKK